MASGFTPQTQYQAGRSLRVTCPVPVICSNAVSPGRADRIPENPAQKPAGSVRRSQQISAFAITFSLHRRDKDWPAYWSRKLSEYYALSAIRLLYQRDRARNISGQARYYSVPPCRRKQLRPDQGKYPFLRPPHPNQKRGDILHLR